MAEQQDTVSGKQHKYLKPLRVKEEGYKTSMQDLLANPGNYAGIIIYHKMDGVEIAPNPENVELADYFRKEERAPNSTIFCRNTFYVRKLGFLDDNANWQ